MKQKELGKNYSSISQVNISDSTQHCHLMMYAEIQAVLLMVKLLNKII